MAKKKINPDFVETKMYDVCRGCNNHFIIFKESFGLCRYCRKVQDELDIKKGV